MQHLVRFQDLDHFQPQAGVVVASLSGDRFGLGELSIVVQSETQLEKAVPLHSHNYLEIFLVQEGHGRYIVGDESCEASAGDVVIVPANTIHGFINIGESRLRHVAIHLAPHIAFSESTRISASHSL